MIYANKSVFRAIQQKLGIYGPKKGTATLFHRSIVPYGGGFPSKRKLDFFLGGEFGFKLKLTM